MSSSDDSHRGKHTLNGDGEPAVERGRFFRLGILNDNGDIFLAKVFFAEDHETPLGYERLTPNREEFVNLYRGMKRTIDGGERPAYLG